MCNPIHHFKSDYIKTLFCIINITEREFSQNQGLGASPPSLVIFSNLCKNHKSYEFETLKLSLRKIFLRNFLFTDPSDPNRILI